MTDSTSIIYLEEKRYKIKEIAPILGIDINKKNLKDYVKIKLNSMGFIEGKDYEFPKGKNGIIIILHVPTEPLDKITYLARLLGVDKQVDPLQFCSFVYYLMEDKHFSAMPWAARVQYLKEKENFTISDRTLRNWVNILVRQDILYKNKENYVWWSSSKTEDGKEIERKEISEDDELFQKYKEWNKQFWAQNEVKNMEDKDKGYIWFREMWEKFQTKFYKCYAYTFGAWYSEILKDLINTYKEYTHK